MGKKSKRTTTQQSSSQSQVNPFGAAREGIEEGIGKLRGYYDFRSDLPLMGDRSADTLAAESAVRNLALDDSPLISGAQETGENLLNFRAPGSRILGGLSALGGLRGVSSLADIARDPFESQAFGLATDRLGEALEDQRLRQISNQAADLSTVGRYRGRGGAVDDLTFGRTNEQFADAYADAVTNLANNQLGRQLQASNALYGTGISGLGDLGRLGIGGAQVQGTAAGQAGNLFNLGLIQPGLLNQIGTTQDVRAEELLRRQRAEELQPLQLGGGILNQLTGVGAAFPASTGSQTGTATSTYRPGTMDWVNTAANVIGAFTGGGGGAPAGGGGGGFLPGGPSVVGPSAQFAPAYAPSYNPWAAFGQTGYAGAAF